MMQVDTGRHPRTPPVAQLLVALLGAGRTPAVTRQALRAAMGGDSADPRPPGDAPVVVVTRESGPATLAPGELVLEDGARLRVAGLVPPDVPLGYHELHPHGGGAPVRVIVSHPGLSPAGRAPHVGVGHPALRRSLGRELGDRRTRGPAPGGSSARSGASV